VSTHSVTPPPPPPLLLQQLLLLLLLLPLLMLLLLPLRPPSPLLPPCRGHHHHRRRRNCYYHHLLIPTLVCTFAHCLLQSVQYPHAHDLTPCPDALIPIFAFSFRVYNPENLEELSFYFRGEKMAKVIGRAAASVRDAVEEIDADGAAEGDGEGPDGPAVRKRTLVGTAISGLLVRDMLSPPQCVHRNV
jgi:hypothetical protein